MYYHIGRCAAPCCEKISKQSYNQIIEEIIKFLEENPKETVQKLTLEMKECAKALDFEKAVKIRDNIVPVCVITTYIFFVVSIAVCILRLPSFCFTNSNYYLLKIDYIQP